MVVVQAVCVVSTGQPTCIHKTLFVPLEPGNKEYKYYAAGIGLVQDGALKLVKHGRTE